MTKKTWKYCDGHGCMYVNMVCTACRKPITEGAFRHREVGVYETMDYQHQSWPKTDPTWAERLNEQIEELTAYLASDAVLEFEKRTGVGSGITGEPAKSS
jgi:hypothetical protein